MTGRPALPGVVVEPGAASERGSETSRAGSGGGASRLDAAIRLLVELAPVGWVRLEGVVALAAERGVARVDWFDRNGQSVRTEMPQDVLDLVRAHRVRVFEPGTGPWWRLIMRASADGRSEVEYDYGDEPFPDDQLLTPEAYLADLQAFPRARVPVWLAAYVRQEDSQRRSARQAAVRARSAGVASAREVAGLPRLAAVWGRWAVLSAAFVAGESERGPRVFPSMGIFEGEGRSGSTLYLLPGDRAVLSGGVWGALDLEVAYNSTGVLPDYYAGAPEWVANQVLNPRAASGLLSFCFWWDRGNWYRGESAEVEQLAVAMPGIRTAEQVVDAVRAAGRADAPRSAVAALVAAAERGGVTRELLTDAVGSVGDIDGAWYQLMLAGLVDSRR
ncbi:hypothetical protein [Nocardia sp. NPDC003979]